MTFQNIRLEHEHELTYLVLNRPDKFNALSRETIREMIIALEQLRDPATTRAVILRAEGKHFCTGHDMSQMVDQGSAVYRDIFFQCCRMMNLLHEIPHPVIAQVQGIATAAGCQLVAACDLVVAEEQAAFSTPGVNIGLFCSTPMVPLSRAVGRKRAMEMLLTGRSVSAVEAAEWGLVNRVVPIRQLAEQTRDLARSIAQASPLTVAIGKQAFYAQIDLAERQAYDLAMNTISLNLTTQDAQDGIRAFLEKRTPHWTGQ